MKRYIFLLLCLIAGAAAIYAQDEYQHGRDEYDRGNFAEAEHLITQSLTSLRGNQRIEAYRLLALCCLNTDRTDEAAQHVASLLAIDPHYTSYNDSPRLTDILNELKSGRENTITTASRQAESLRESPVPVTLITEDMIRASGAQNLRDLLCLYVPNMTRVEGMEPNICMRGVVGANQEDILIMLDGQRLNSYATNCEAPDFRTSLDKIKQIEVLRGPASSLYGNAALMAVVNIITKKGSSVDGAQVRLLGGTYRTIGASLLYGKGNLNNDLLAWGNVYISKGEAINFEGTRHYINGFNTMPALDFGIKTRWDDVTLTVTAQHAKAVPFYSQLAFGPYSYDKYVKENGSKPGTSRSSINATLNYNHAWERFSISASAYGNLESTQIYNVVADSLRSDVATGLLQAVGVKGGTSDGIGLWETLGWKDMNIGININGDYEYSFGSQKGSLLIGMQSEWFSMIASKFQLAGHYKYINQVVPDIIPLETESSNSVYLQLKHYFLPQLIFNGGVRYDYKKRYEGEQLKDYNRNIHVLSPRIALIWSPNQTYSYKLGCARSFVDAPYVYRANRLALYSGGERLPYQLDDAVQATAIGDWRHLHLKGEFNLFYHNIHDLIIYSVSNMAKDMNGIKTPFTMAQIKTAGAEASVEWTNPTSHTFVHLNACYKYAFDMHGYSNFEHKIGNEPYVQLNLVVSQRLLSSPKAGTFTLRANLHAQTSAEMEQSDLRALYDPSYQNNNVHCPSQALVNAGLDWQWRCLNLNFDVYNVFNTNYKVGSQLQSWIPYQSTHFVAKLGVRF